MVELILIFGASAALLSLPYFYLPKLNHADSGATKTKSTKPSFRVAAPPCNSCDISDLVGLLAALGLVGRLALLVRLALALLAVEGRALLLGHLLALPPRLGVKNY